MKKKKTKKEKKEEGEEEEEEEEEEEKKEQKKKNKKKKRRRISHRGQDQSQGHSQGSATRVQGVRVPRVPNFSNLAWVAIN